MRKDVLRSLILWPAIASATISGIWWHHKVNSSIWQSAVAHAKITWHQAGGPAFIEPYLSDRFAWDQSPVAIQPPEFVALAPPQPLPQDSQPLCIGTEIAERTEQGAAAMRVPERLAVREDENRSDAAPLFAPRIDELLETAGLSPRSPQGNEADEIWDDIFAGPDFVIARIDDNDVSVGAFSETADVTVDLAASPVAVPPPPTAAPQVIPAETTEIGDLVVRITDQGASITDLAVSITDLTATTREAEPNPSEPQKSILPSSIANLGDLAAPQPDEPVPPPAVATIDVEKTAKAANRSIDINPATWPLTTRLNEQLETLATLTLNQTQSSTNKLVSAARTSTLASLWVDQVRDCLSQLRTLDRLGNPLAGELIAELDALSIQGYQQAEQTLDREQQIEWLRTAYALARRVAVWKPVFQIAELASAASYPAAAPASSIANMITQIRAELDETGDAAGWDLFLLLDEIIAASTSDQNVDRNLVAKRFLSRLQWHGLDPLHIAWLERDSITQLSDAVRPWASEAVDYAALLHQLERREADALAYTDREICDVFQTLRFAENRETVAVADALNTHYRNANVRIALTETMLSRMLPSIKTSTVPVRTQILGSKVRGMSRIESQLQIDLQPAADRWALKLRTLGNVKTQSVGRNGPAVFNTNRDSRFAAETPLEITSRDYAVGNPLIEVQGSTRLRGIRTNYDGWPLFGPLIRDYAEIQYYKASGLSNRIADRKMKVQIADELNQQLNERLEDRSNQFEQVVLGPLASMQLDPMVVDLNTTDQRLTARYRLAGDWQLGAFTPRPRAPRSSLMSLQVHQSAINNTMERLVPRTQSKAIDQMVLDGLLMFGQPASALPDDLPDDVEIQFAKSRPVTLEIVDGSAWITLKIVRLTRDRLKLSHFIVRAEYRPEIDGLNASLVREGHLRISGPGMSMRERLPVRAIFNKVLSPTRKFALTVPALVEHPKAQDLAVSQLELRDGWIGLAISEQTAPRIALRPAASK
jgi:hypothetical protein